MEKLKQRKTTRLKGANYNYNKAVFLTVCTKDRKCILSRIVGTGVPDGPQKENVGTGVLDGPQKENVGTGVPDGPQKENVGTGVPDGPHIELTQYGLIAYKYINQINAFYETVSVESYVIMPNHIHIMLYVKDNCNGPSGTPVPTEQNTLTARFLSTFKRFCNKECGENIWQYRSYDHIIRSRIDYEEHMRYIYENPKRWYYDELYRDE